VWLEGLGIFSAVYSGRMFLCLLMRSGEGRSVWLRSCKRQIAAKSCLLSQPAGSCLSSQLRYACHVTTFRTSYKNSTAKTMIRFSSYAQRKKDQSNGYYNEEIGVALFKRYSVRTLAATTTHPQFMSAEVITNEWNLPRKLYKSQKPTRGDSPRHFWVETGSKFIKAVAQKFFGIITTSIHQKLAFQQQINK
jgi:hypothetical protein